MFRYRNLAILLFTLSGFVSAFLSGYFLNSYFDGKNTEFPVLGQAYKIMSDHAYVDLPGEKPLEYGMIRGMLEASGDSYAVFLEPVQHELQTNSLQGSFGGIGVELKLNQNGDVLVYPIADGPAFRAGVQSGDLLKAVDNLIINENNSLDDIRAAIRGRVGKKVKIITSRASDFTDLEFNIEREQIHQPSVTFHADSDHPSVGVINVNVIAESTSQEIQDAVSELENDGVAHFVLDLRNNGGGLLSAGVEISRLFLMDGIIIHQQYRGEEIETFSVAKPGTLKDLSLVILVNHSTASAAEIIAGSLQAHGRALLIGEPTFGKDTIQLVFDLQDDSSLHVTAAKWWIPGLDFPVGEYGLKPDLQVDPSESDQDNILNVAIQSLLGE